MKNETTRFLKKAKTGMQSNIDIEEIILDQLKLEKTADDIAYELEQYGIDYYDALDRVENVVDTLYTRFAEEDKNADLLEGIEEEEVEPVKKAPLYSLNDQWASEDSSFDEFDDEVEDDIQQEEDDQEEDADETFNVKKQGGTIGKKKFVKNIVRGLKKAAEGVEQEQSFQATILDKPIKGRASFNNDFKRGIKDLGNEYYAKEIYNETQALQNEVQQLPTAPSYPTGQNGIEMQQDMENPMHHYNAYADSVSNIFKQPMNQVNSVGFGNLPEARRGREQRQSDRQQRQMSKDFNNAFGDVAAGYFGVPGMPNYLQMVNVVDPSVMAKNKETPEPSKFPGIDFEYNKGPWWSGKRSWSAKGVPAEMLMGSGRNLNYGNQNFGYGNNTYGSSWSKSYSYPGEIIKRKAAIINSVADPTKVNNVELKNNPAKKSTNTEWQTDGRRAQEDSASDANVAYWTYKPNYVSSGIPDSELTPGIFEDRQFSSPFSESDYNKVAKKIYKKDGFIDWPLYDKLSQEEQNIINQGSYLQKDSKGNEYSVVADYLNPEAKVEENKLELDNRIKRGLFDLNSRFNLPGQVKVGINPSLNPVSTVQEQVNTAPSSSEPFSSQEYLEDEYGDIVPELGTEDYGQSMKWSDFMNSNPSKEEIDYEIQYRLGKRNKRIGNGYGEYPPPSYYPYGGSIDSQNPDLYKFIYGGDDEYEDYSNNYANSKNVEDPYMRDGGLYKAQYGQSESYASSDPDFANREAYNAAVSNNLTNEAYNPKTTYTGVNSNYSKANNSKTGTLNSSSNTGNGYQVGDQIRSDGSVWRGNTQISDGKDAISENSSSRTINNQGNYGYPTAAPIKNQIWNALGKNLKVFNKDFTWASQDGPLRDASGNPISMPNSFSNATKDQAGFVQDYKYEKGPWWKGNKQSLEVKNRYFDPKNPTGGTNSFSDGKGPVAAPATSGANPSTPGTSADTPDVKKFQDSQTAQGKVWDEQKQRWVNSGYNPTATGPGYSGYNADSEGNTIPDYLQPGVMSGSAPAAQPVGPTLAYGGYMDFGGYVPEFDPGGQFDGTGPFDPNDSGIAGGGTGPCTEEQVKNAKLGDPCYNEAYSNKIPQDFTAKYKLNDAKTMNTAAIANIGEVAGLAAQGVSDLQNNIYNQDYFNNNISYSGNRVPTTYTDNTGGVSGLNQRAVGAPRFTGVVGAAAYSKKGGELSYQKGGVYDLSQEEIGKILAAGGQIKFIK
jgi:hypothetical protein